MRDDLHMTCFLDVIRPGLRSAVAARLCFPPRCSAVVLGLSAALSGHYNMICNGDSDNRKKNLSTVSYHWFTMDGEF